MQFRPRTEEELNQILLLKDGEYEFEVQSAIEKLSKSNNEMIEIRLNIFESGERVAVLTDYLLESMSFKLRHFCDTVGMIENYNQGKLDPVLLIGLAGKAIIKTEKDTTGKYKDKNVIKDYVKRKTTQNTGSENLPF